MATGGRGWPESIDKHHTHIRYETSSWGVPWVGSPPYSGTGYAGSPRRRWLPGGNDSSGGPTSFSLWLNRASGWGTGIYAAADLSFTTLCRVGEISSPRRLKISKVGSTYQRIQRDHRQITRHLCPYAQAWASWLRRIASGEAPALGRAAHLEMGRAKLLQGTGRGEARWHAWRRAVATYLGWLELPWRHLLSWDRWHSIKMAHVYAFPPTNLNVCILPDCLGQLMRESDGEKQISGNCGCPASWSSLKMTRWSRSHRLRSRGHGAREDMAGPRRRRPQENGQSTPDARREEARNPGERTSQEPRRQEP